MYSKGILLKAKIYIVLVSKFEKTTTLNKQQERALWTFMSRKDDFANWVWKISDFSTLWQFTWQSGTILKVLDTRQSRMNLKYQLPNISVQFVVYPLLTLSKRHLLLANCL